ncbi:MAG: selenium cofactor biosynthesis protein YqeC [Candidatus Limiplasma sp.]|nr:selenium cofactor biosynthesis protein YqeC [Candidatus Limiplasma sp.]
MSLSALLGLEAGERVAVVGCGGKTSLIGLLAAENAPQGVLIAPTTRIGLAQRVSQPGIAYLGQPQGEKLCAAPLEDILTASAAYPLTLMEADGSKGLPLKGWADHEPVVPDFTTLTIGVVSAKAVGLPATPEHAHRLPLFLTQAGLGEGDVVEEAAVARMIRWCMDRHGRGRLVVAVNQADTPLLRSRAARIARELEGFTGIVLMGTTGEGSSWERI